jgi:hypothetical protein
MNFVSKDRNQTHIIGYEMPIDCEFSKRTKSKKTI